MSSSSRSRMNRRYWMKNGLYSKFLVGLCCLAVISMIIFSAIAIYEFRVAGVERCQVHSTDVIKRKNLFYPRWTIQIQYEERTIVEHMIGSIGQSTASRAWRIVEQYKVRFELKVIAIFLFIFRSIKHMHVIVRQIKTQMINGFGNRINYRNLKVLLLF